MAFDFPASPTVGQAFNGWVWDGEKWQMQGSAAQGAVRYDAAQALTAAQQIQARSNIYAAPFDALAYSGMQINGSMEVSQERGTSATTTSGTYVVDGFLLFKGGTMGVSAASAVSSIAAGFPNVLYLIVSTAQASLGGGDYTIISQFIEGFRASRLAWGTASAQPITIGFWSQHQRTGVYSVSIANAAGNRCYAAPYTHNVSNANQYNVITIPGDTAGVWLVDNGKGLQINFTIAAGATLTAPAANTWAAGNYIAAPGQVNGVASTSDVFRLTGVVVLPGLEAPPAARSPLIMRPYDQELLTCQRYLQQIELGQIAGGTVTPTVIFAKIPFKTQMRAPPTLIPATGANTFYQASSNSTFTGTGMSLNFASTSGMEVQFSGFTGLTTGGGTCLWRASVGAIMVDARL